VARRRGTRLGVVLLVLLVLVGGGLVIADRVAASMAENQISAQAKKEMVARKITAASDPKVTIGGFPFLTQVLAGKYEKITIAFDRPDISGVQLDRLELVASTVRADASAVIRGNGSVVADKVTGTANMGWDAVRKQVQLAGLPSGFDPSKVEVQVLNNQVQLRIPLQVNGVSFALRATGTLAVEAGKVRLQLTSVTSDQGDPIPVVQNLVKQYQDRLRATVNIPALPYKLVVNKIETSDAGVLLIATAANVTLASNA
jgi:hypothetical protein